LPQQEYFKMTTKEQKESRLLFIREWIRKDGGKIDPALGPPPEPPQSHGKGQGEDKGTGTHKHAAVLQQSQGATEKLTESSPSPKAFKEQSIALRKALLQYQDLNIEPRLDLDVDKCTWDDVLRCISQAGVDYKTKADGWRGTGHRFLRKAGDVADSIDPWLQLIPDDAGGSIIGAAISIALKVRLQHARCV
jgi:hypothetical protein